MSTKRTPLTPEQRREQARRAFRAGITRTMGIVVFGHSHVPYIEDVNGLLLLNPGSATDRRTQPHCTIALLTIKDGHPHAEIIALP